MALSEKRNTFHLHVNGLLALAPLLLFRREAHERREVD